MQQPEPTNGATPATVTFAKDTIHNPADVRHFMKLKPVERRVRILYGTTLLAETTTALRLLETGFDMYDPALYISQSDLVANFVRSEKTSHCPLKGDANYLHLTNEAGEVIEENIAWTYGAPFEFASEIADRVSFFTHRVRLEEAPL